MARKQPYSNHQFRPSLTWCRGQSFRVAAEHARKAWRCRIHLECSRLTVYHVRGWGYRKQTYAVCKIRNHIQIKAKWKPFWDGRSAILRGSTYYFPYTGSTWIILTHKPSFSFLLEMTAPGRGLVVITFMCGGTKATIIAWCLRSGKISLHKCTPKGGTSNRICCFCWQLKHEWISKIHLTF